MSKPSIICLASKQLLWLTACVLTAAGAVAQPPDPQYESDGIIVPSASADEPLRETFSAQAADQHLQDGALAWSASNKCITCHTNGTYLAMRPALTQWLGDPASEVREFAVDILNKRKGQSTESLRKSIRPGEAIYIAAGLAEWDRHVTGELSSETREALSLILRIAGESGDWPNPVCWPPYESDSYYLATMAAMAIGSAPTWLESKKSATDSAGVAKLRAFLNTTEPPHDYGRTMLLWASSRFPGVLTEADKQAVVSRLRDLQRADGGWSIRSFAEPAAWGSGNRAAKLKAEPEFDDPPSDGHQTGLVVVALRSAGIAETDPAIQKAIAWIKSNQRQSGRWWARSLNTDKAHYLTYSATALALLALGECGELENSSVAANR